MYHVLLIPHAAWRTTGAPFLSGRFLRLRVVVDWVVRGNGGGGSLAGCPLSPPLGPSPQPSSAAVTAAPAPPQADRPGPKGHKRGNPRTPKATAPQSGPQPGKPPDEPPSLAHLRPERRDTLAAALPKGARKTPILHP